MKMLLRTPKTQLGIIFFLIFLTAFINNPSLKIVFLYILLLFFAVISDLVFLKIRDIPLFFPSAALVSASIITLVVNPNLSWYQLFLIAVLAIASKNFLRVSNRHIFNPAGFGLFVGSLMFPNAISWWGVSWQQFPITNYQLLIPFFILLSPALISIIRMRRYRIILSFLITYVFLLSITYVFLYMIGSIFANFKFQIPNFLLDPTLLFFSLVMLPEPMTTPNRRIQQILFGIFVAVLSLIAPLLTQNFQLDPLITSLLIGNLIFFKFR